MQKFKAWLIDTAERTVLSAAEAFLAVFVVTDLSSAKSAAVAGVAAGLTVVKSAVASLRAGTVSPASLVKPEG